jgi:hypothetical protein
LEVNCVGNPLGDATFARELTGLLEHWQKRAELYGAIERNTMPDPGWHFVITSDRGGVRVDTRDSGGARLYVSTLAPFSFGVVEVYPDRVVEDNATPLSHEGRAAVVELLEPHPSEIAPLIELPYGFVANDRVVAITYTAEADRPSGTDRVELGMYPEIYVADANEFRRLSRPQQTLQAWYMHFWTQVQRGHVVKLMDRVRDLPGQIWASHEGLDGWMEVEGSDSETPAFITNKRYVECDWRTNEPWRRERSSFKRIPMKRYFLDRN